MPDLSVFGDPQLRTNGSREFEELGARELRKATESAFCVASLPCFSPACALWRGLGSAHGGVRHRCPSVEAEYVRPV